jgi:hypothetical protein
MLIFGRNRVQLALILKEKRSFFGQGCVHPRGAPELVRRIFFGHAHADAECIMSVDVIYATRAASMEPIIYYKNRRHSPSALLKNAKKKKKKRENACKLHSATSCSQSIRNCGRHFSSRDFFLFQLIRDSFQIGSLFQCQHCNLLLARTTKK